MSHSIPPDAHDSDDSPEGSSSFLSPRMLAVGLLIGGGLLLLNGLAGSGGSGAPPNAGAIPAPSAAPILTNPMSPLSMTPAAIPAKAGKVMNNAIDSADMAAKAVETGARVTVHGLETLESLANQALQRAGSQPANPAPAPALPSSNPPATQP